MNIQMLSITGLLVCLLAVQALETRGVPGVDYPNYLTIPKTFFRCSDQKYIPGFYADMETSCQVYHFCSKDKQETFLCPTGSIFNQATLACDMWYNSSCSLAPLFFKANSGTLLESATKNVPMLVKLRNRSQNKSAVRAATGDVYEKISSLYGNNEDAAKLETQNFNIPNGNSKSNSKNGNVLQFDSNASEDVKNSHMKDILAKLGGNILNSGSEDGGYYGDSLVNDNDAEKDIPENLIYDPVTEQYYVEYDSSQNAWQQETDSDKFGFYNYDKLVNKYGLVMDDSEASDSSKTTSLDSEIGHVDNAEPEELPEELLGSEQPGRVRRKPIYTVVRQNEDDDPYSGVVFPSSVRGVKKPNLDTDESSTDASEQPSEMSTAASEAEHETETDPPFEMTDELRYPFTPLNHTEVPMTSEEFEHAILTELVEPKIDELDLKLLASESDQQQSSQASLNRAARAFQSDEQYVYVDGMPEGYSQVYNGDGLPVEQRNEEILVEDYVEPETYVVIPDEGDVLYSEDGMISDDATYYDMENEEQNKDASDVARNLYNAYSIYPDSHLQNYESPEAYAAVDKPQFSDEFQEQQISYYNPETGELVSPYDYADSYVADEAVAFRPEYRETFEGCAFSAPESYCRQPVPSTDYMYGTQDDYYSRFYTNPYQVNGNLDYEIGSEELSESHARDSVDADESSRPVRVSTYPSVEPGSEYFNADGSHSVDSSVYSSEDAASSANVDLTEIYQLDGNAEESFQDKDLNKDETYYVLDLDADGNSESLTSVTEISETEDRNDLQSSQLGNAVQSKLAAKLDGESSNPTDTVNVFLQDKNINLPNMESADSSVNLKSGSSAGFWSFPSSESAEKFVELSDLGRSDYSTAESMMSDGGSKYFPGNRFLHNAEIPESTDFGSYRVPASSGQQPKAKKGSMSSNTRNKEFLHRSGNSGEPSISKLSVLQERIKSLKQGKFGAFKKYVSSTGNKE